MVWLEMTHAPGRFVTGTMISPSRVSSPVSRLAFTVAVTVDWRDQVRPDEVGPRDQDQCRRRPGLWP